jgi:hypothetical protein
LRILAHASEQRSPLAPDIPTFAEAGYPGYVAVTSSGLYAKAGIPRSIAADYAAIVTEALAEQQMVELLHMMGMVPMGGTPAEFRNKVMADRAVGFHSPGVRHEYGRLNAMPGPLCGLRCDPTMSGSALVPGKRRRALRS